MNLPKQTKAGRAVLLVCACAALQQSTALGAKSKVPPPPKDLTKEHNWDPGRSLSEPGFYNLGPTGMVGFIPQRGKGDHEAEKDENGGRLTFTVWRDRNYSKRNASVDFSAVSVEDLFEEIANDTDSELEGWRNMEQHEAAIKEEWRGSFKEWPLDPVTKEVTLTLEVMGSFSDTSPWDCPKTRKILERGWKVLERNIGHRSNVGRFKVRGLALLASGRPEHVELVKEAVHANPSFMGEKKVGNDGWGWHYGSWHAGYTLVFLGEYYLRTGDEAILPGLRKWAVAAAKLQSGGGTWGHSAAERKSNFGRLGGPCPGYGAMNQAGGVCFFGLTLAQKSGIDEPLVDLAIKRAIRFNSTFVDKGCVPYGYHAPAGHEDSNGKNGPPAFAMRMVGELYKAKYFAQNSNAGSCWGYRAGHGNGTFGNYWPHLAANLCGREGVIHWMKKMRPHYAMLRKHDGAFVNVTCGNSGGIGTLFDPTGIAILHYSAPMRELYVTGRDQLPELQHTQEDLMNLVDQSLPASIIRDLSTEDIFRKLNTFSTKRRRQFYCPELARRYLGGETAVIARLKSLLSSPKSRERDAAIHAISACGRDVAKPLLPKLAELALDPEEFVRVAAVRAIGVATRVPNSKVGRRGSWTNELGDMLEPLLKAALTEFENDTTDIGNTHNALQQVLLSTDNPFARDPYNCGVEEELVTKVLERFFRMDPRQWVMDGPAKFWDRDTVIKMAGPVFHVAERKPLNGVMFGGAPVEGGRKLLEKYGFEELFEASCGVLIGNARAERDIRPRLATGRQAWFDAKRVLKYKGLYKHILPDFRTILVEHPNLAQRYFVGKTSYSLDLIKAVRMIDSDKVDPIDNDFVSLRKLAIREFNDKLDRLGEGEQVALCRKELDPTRHSYFKQIAVMTRLVELAGAKAVPDLGPYIRHEVHRLREHARKLIAEMTDRATPLALARLAAHNDESIAAGALEMLATRGDRSGRRLGLGVVVDHDSPLVRGAAAQAIYGCSGGDDIGKLMMFVRSADSRDELLGYEKALLMSRKDAERSRDVGAVVRKSLGGCSPTVRRSLYYVLGQLGGEENLSFLKREVVVEDDDEFATIIDSLARSPDVSATKVLLRILADHQGTQRAHVISKLSLKRMVNGAEVVGRVPDDVNLDFAEAHLPVVRSLEVIKFMGNIHKGRCLDILFRYMKKGPARVTEACAQSIIAAAEGMSPKLPLAERKAAADVLAQVIEYVNVVHTRGGVMAHMRKEDRYVFWKSIADRAGAALKRIYSPEEDDVGDFDDDDLDL